MIKITDIIGIEKEDPKNGEVRIWEKDPRTRVTTQAFLTNVPEGTLVFPYKQYNPNLANHICKSSVHFGPTRTASPRRFCDYLVMFRRSGMYCPVFIELAETSSSPYIGKKFEQLLGALPVMELYRTCHDCVLNGELIIDAPRFLLLNVKDGEKTKDDDFRDLKLHRDHPRVVKCATPRDAAVSVFYYGGSNKIIKVARAIVGKPGKLDVAEIFRSLPTPEPSPKIAARLKVAYHRLMEQEQKRQH